MNKEKIIIRKNCCEKWDRRGILPLSVLGDDKYGKHFGAIEIKFCPECGNQLREIKTT